MNAMVQLEWIDTDKLIAFLKEKGVYIRRQNHPYMMMIIVQGCFNVDVHLEDRDGRNMYANVKLEDYARIDLNSTGIAIREVRKSGNRFYETGQFAGLYFKDKPEFVNIGPFLEVRVALHNNSWLDFKSCKWWA